MALRAVSIDLGADSPEALDERYTVVLLHGFGASMQDLVPLAGELGVFRRWLFPGAPYPIRVHGMTYGSAWFPRSDDELEPALYGSYFRNLRTMEPAGLSESAREIGELLDAQGLDPGSVILGGFSQGSMVAVEFVRQRIVAGRALPAALLLFSGALIAEAWWREVFAERLVPAGNGGAGAGGAVLGAARLPQVVQSHGTSDTVLPFAEGGALRDTLKRAGFPVTFVSFRGGHEIPRPALEAASDLLHTVAG